MSPISYFRVSVPTTGKGLLDPRAQLSLADLSPNGPAFSVFGMTHVAFCSRLRKKRLRLRSHGALCHTGSQQVTHPGQDEELENSKSCTSHCNCQGSRGEDGGNGIEHSQDDQSPAAPDRKDLCAQDGHAEKHRAEQQQDRTDDEQGNNPDWRLKRRARSRRADAGKDRGSNDVEHHFKEQECEKESDHAKEAECRQTLRLDGIESWQTDECDDPPGCVAKTLREARWTGRFPSCSA